MDAKTLISRINQKNQDSIKAISINGDIATCQCLKCNKIFETKVNNVLYKKRYGCRECGLKASTLSEDDIKVRLKEIHGNKIEIISIYKDGKKHETFIECRCTICGHVWNGRSANILSPTQPTSCPNCTHNMNKTQDDEFKAKIKENGHDINFVSSFVKDSKSWVTCHCNVCGNDFSIRGRLLNKGKGCPYCKHHYLEKEVENMLKSQGYSIETQKRFDWLNGMTLDVFIPSKSIAIECQGIQHFKPINFFGGEETFKKQIERDKNKFELCTKNNIKLLYFSNLKIKTDYEIITDIEELKKEIENS